MSTTLQLSDSRMDGLGINFKGSYDNVFMHDFDAYGNVITNAWDKYNDVKRLQFGNDAAYVIKTEQLTWLQNKIASYLRWKEISESSIPNVFVGAGTTKVELAKNNNVGAPRPTKTLDNGKYQNAAFETSTFNLIGLDYDIYLDKITVDAGNNTQNKKVVYTPNPQQNQMNAFSESMVEYVEWFKWRGYDVPGLTGVVPTTYTGIVNTTGFTNPGALGLGDDDNLTAVGDVYDSAITMADYLINLKFEPPFDLHWTPKVMSTALKSVSATAERKSDLQMIRELANPNGSGRMFNNIYMNPFLINSATETTSTGAMAVIKSRPEENFIANSYPIGVYPMTTLGMGWAIKMLWYGGYVANRPEAVCFADNLTTG
jgi:hypothetical protein